MSLRALQMALLVLSALFVLFAGWVAFATAGQVHWSIPVAFVVIPLSVVAGIWIWTKLKSKASARKLERALARDAAHQAELSGPAASGEVLRLQAEFTRAVNALKQTSLSGHRRNGQDALYRLPWYVMLGPPGVGKSTVLRNSGIQFPHIAGTGSRIKGVGGTRNCDWWLTNHGILLDTAGRWTTEEEDHNEWLAFLEQLKRHRSRQPLNGVIAALSLAGDPETSIAELDDSQLKNLAGRMRERLDELSTQLGVILPVYVVFTKCDLLSGFVETFGDLSSAERRQIWGFTTPLLQVSKDHYGEHFESRFEELCEVLERHSLQRMEQEVRADQVAQILDFPAQVRSLQPKLSLFVRQLFEDHVFTETPILRGVYLTSGTQEGAPADLLRHDLAGALQLDAPPAQDAEQEKKSYFLYDMLTKVVFADHHIATNSPAVIKRRQLQQRVWTSSLLGVALLSSLLSFLAFRQQALALARTYGAVGALQAAGLPNPQDGRPAREPEVARIEREAKHYQERASSALPALGMGPQKDLATRLGALHAASLREWIVRPLWNQNSADLIQLTHQFEGMAQGQLGTLVDDDRQRLRTALRTHLRMSRPRESCEPSLEDEHQQLTRRLLDLWQEQLPTDDPHVAANRRSQLEAYLQLASSEAYREMLGFERASDRVEIARAALADQKGADQLLVGLTERFSEEPLGLAQMVGASTWLAGNHAVPSAYTAAAWRRLGRELSTDGLRVTVSGDWVLGCQRLQLQDKQQAAQTADLRRLYLEQYEAQWRQFLAGLVVTPPRSLAEAETWLTALTARPGVLGNLFQEVHTQTRLPQVASPVDALADKAQAVTAQVTKLAQAGQAHNGEQSGSTAAGVGAAIGLGAAPEQPKDLTRLRRTFDSFTSFGVPQREGMTPPLEAYRQQLTGVQAALRGASVDSQQYARLSDTVRAATAHVETLIEGQGGAWTGVLRELLLPPLLAISSLAQGDAAQALQTAYCDEVYRPFQDELAGRYPLDPRSNEDVSLEALEDFFKPRTGILWTFQQETLNGLVVGDGRRFRFGEAAGMHGREVLREDLLRVLGSAARLRDALFSRSGDQVRMPFRVRVRGAAGYRLTSLDLGGTEPISYVNGEERWVPQLWPGEAASEGAELQVVPHSGPGPRPLHIAGIWGLFKLLDPQHGHATILERRGRRLTAGWKPRGSLSYVKVDFEADQSQSLLLHAPLGRQGSGSLLPLSMPRRITHSGPDC